VTDDTITKIN